MVFLSISSVDLLTVLVAVYLVANLAKADIALTLHGIVARRRFWRAWMPVSTNVVLYFWRQLCPDSSATDAVYFGRHRLHVIRVNASTIPAKVIRFVSIRYRTFVAFVRYSMRVDGANSTTFPHRHLAVACRFLRCSPLPTSGLFVNLDVSEKALFQGKLFSGHVGSSLTDVSEAETFAAFSPHSIVSAEV